MNEDAFSVMERMLREETAGEYVIGRMLGRGGMAVVYLAEEPKLGRKVALKVLPPELTFGHGVERFLREAKTAANLDHPHIIPIYRIGSTGRLFWYAMKFLEGKSLEDELKERGTLPLDTTIQILEQVGDALDYAHERGVIHRDVKPANVMLDSRNRVTLTDFGIAKALSDGGLTATGSLVGTPYYMSPEQGRGKAITGAADQYSVGVMAFAMLTGQVPFNGDSAIDVLHQHCMNAAPKASDFAPHLPPHVSAVIDKALAKDPAERFPTCRALAQALKDPEVQFARASGRTLLIDSSELRLRLESGLPPENSLPGKAGASTAKTTESPVPAAPAASGGKKGVMIAAAAAAVIAIGAFAMNGKTDSAEASSTPDATAVAAPAAGSATTPSATPDDDTPAETKVATVANSNAPAQTPPSTRNAPTERTAPTNTAPAPSTPAPTATRRPAAAAGVAELLLVLPTPGLVTIDGVDRGEQSRMRDSVRAGTHNIRISRSGFAPIDTTISFGAGESKRVILQLVAQP